MITAPAPQTLHFVYVKGSGLGAPMSITREVTTALSKHFNIIVHDWLSPERIEPNKGDILLGHPHPYPTTIFQRSVKDPRWSKRIILSPFAHRMPEYIAFLDPLIEMCDQYLAICGSYWIKSIDESLCAHWLPRMTQIDMAINRVDYPFLKKTWNSVGKRKAVYIGSVGINKGTDALARLAKMCPEIEWFWIGYGNSFSEAIKSLGQMNFEDKSAQEILAGIDFLVHTGRSDANPTTILEAASWGLIPFCTKESGYKDEPMIVSIPLDDTLTAARIMNEFNGAPESKLIDIQQKAQKRFEHFSWDRFTNQILEALRGSQLRSAYDNSSRTKQNRQMLAKLAQAKLRRDRVIHYKNRVAHLLKRGLRWI